MIADWERNKLQNQHSEYGSTCIWTPNTHDYNKYGLGDVYEKQVLSAIRDRMELAANCGFITFQALSQGQSDPDNSSVWNHQLTRCDRVNKLLLEN
jgi:hypothetical protein